jgi:hypothetical protein
MMHPRHIQANLSVEARPASRARFSFAGLAIILLLTGLHAGPLTKEYATFGFSYGTVLVYPPAINKYMSVVEEPLNDPLFPRKLIVAHGAELSLEFKPLRYLEITPWLAGLYSARRFRWVDHFYFNVPVVVRFADLSSGVRLTFGSYLAHERVHVHGGVAVSQHLCRLHIIEDTDHEMTTWATQYSLVAGGRLRVFNTLSFGIELEVPVNALPLRYTSRQAFGEYELSNRAPLPADAYLWRIAIWPEIRVNLKKMKVPDVL